MTFFDLSYAKNQSIPHFTEESHNNGDLLRHTYKLKTDLKYIIAELERKGFQHLGLERALKELEDVTKNYTDINKYYDFLEKKMSLFNANSINIETVPKSIQINWSFGIFTLPYDPIYSYSYINNILNQLNNIHSKNPKVENLQVNRLIDKVSKLLQTQNNLGLENFLKENHATLQNVGVKDPRNKGFTEKSSPRKSQGIAPQSMQQ
jgi:hypothetical protein